MRVSRRLRVTLLLISLAIALLGAISHKYIWLYASRKLKRSSFPAQFLPNPTASTEPNLLLTEANRLAWVFNWPKAEPLYARAEELFKEKRDTRNEIYARVGRIRAQSETMSYVDVSQMIESEIERPIVKADPTLRLWCLAQKGYTDLEINAASAKRAWLEARALAHSLGETQWEARAEGELGIIAFLEGDSKQAATMVGDAVMSAFASGDVGEQVRALEMLGNGFNEVQRYGEALAFFDRAIKISGQNPDCGFPYMAYEGKGWTLAGEGQFDEAGRTLDYALAIARQNEKYGHQSQILVEKGELALRTGNRQQAIEYLQQGGDLGQKHAFFRMAAQAMFDLARIYRDAGDLKSAEDRAAIGVDVSRKVGDRYYLPRDLTVLADLKARQGQTTAAEKFYAQAEDVIDGMLVNTDEAYWNSSMADAMSDTYLRHFELEARLGNVEKAFRVLERVRGRTPAALLENGGSSTRNEPKEVTVLETEVASLQLRLMRSEDATDRAILLDQLVEYERRLGWTRTDQETTKPEWFERPAALKNIQSLLRADEMILEYVLSEPQSYCLWISRNGAGIERLSGGRGQIEDLTRRYITSIREKRSDSSLASQLFAVLFSPVSKHSAPERLVIVPDGILHLLPFETLRDASNSLLLEKQIVSYAPASTVLYAIRTAKNSHTRRRTLLAVGNAPYQNQGNVSAQLVKPRGMTKRLLRGMSDSFRTPLYDLPETRDEVLDIRRILGNDTTLLLGQEATETAFKAERLSDFKIIHLAVHGFSDSRFPERSGVVLGVDSATSDDGLLQVREIIHLRFNADLVTLSACDTGVGKLQGEEGVTDLAEAFLVSGSRSVVASLWSADDTFTHALMNRFYTHIAEGMDQASALRDAKRDLLAKYGKEVPPYYWGAFVLTGDGGSPIRLGVQ
ncbi:MAG TPA: CHAT domain-containing protein [Candidatus Dormibacteraeota bacterium]|nr:CHAT domain-containing protein [Candidatus Dormibacteraeota bacterium]